ncbi:hypothetical protein GGI21_002975, partial [Coemansia aciculifera]
LDEQRHHAVAQQQALTREHVALKRAYGRALGSQARMKQQVARLTQLAATGASEARMRRLEAALGEAECQHQALLWASMDQRRVSPELEVVTETGGTALVTALRAKLKIVTADREQAQRELRTAHLLRANETQRTRDIEREAADSESKLRRAVGELAVLRADHDALKRAVKSSRKQVRSPHAAHGSTEQVDDAHDADRQPSSPLPPPRKRTSVKAGGSPPGAKMSGPMSLAFVVNSSGESPPHLLPAHALKSGGSPPAVHPAKRQRVASDSATTIVESDISDINQAAADRGLKSWLGTLGAVHASETIGEQLAGGGGGDSTSAVKAEEGNASASSSAPVDEIYVSSRMSQKPIECNTQ